MPVWAMRAFYAARVLALSTSVYVAGKAAGLAEGVDDRDVILNALIHAHHKGDAQPQRLQNTKESDRLERVAEIVLGATREYIDERIHVLESQVSVGLEEIDERAPSKIGTLKDLLRAKRKMGNPFTFVLTSSGDVNAFVSPFLPDHIIMHMGVFKELEPSDDELAFLIAHEIAHQLHDHPRRTLNLLGSALQAQLLVLSLLNPVGFLSLAVSMSFSIWFDGFYLRSNFRDREMEADKTGIEIMKRTTYDPVAARSIMDRLTVYCGSHRLFFHLRDWMDTHPRLEDRSKSITSVLEKS